MIRERGMTAPAFLLRSLALRPARPLLSRLPRNRKRPFMPIFPLPSRPLFGLAMLACALGLAGCGEKEAPQRGPVEVGVLTLTSGPVTISTELPGRTASTMISEVRPQVAGIIQKRLFEEGSYVKAGQPLYQIDPSLYRASHNEANAALSSAQLDTASINLRFTRVYAPISGRIGRSLVTPGALVTANQATALATIQQLDPIYVDITQSSAKLLQLRRALAAGQVLPASATIRLKLDDGTDYPQSGTIEFTEPIVDPNSGTVTLRARFPNPEGLLMPGMFVRVVAPQSVVPNAILAPQRGVSRDAKGAATVLVVTKDNKVERRTIAVENAIGDKWLVTEGLKAGERIIVEGINKVSVGDTVKPVPVGAEK